MRGVRGGASTPALRAARDTGLCSGGEPGLKGVSAVVGREAARDTGRDASGDAAANESSESPPPLEDAAGARGVSHARECDCRGSGVGARSGGERSGPGEGARSGGDSRFGESMVFVGVGLDIARSAPACASLLRPATRGADASTCDGGGASMGGGGMLASMSMRRVGAVRWRSAPSANVGDASAEPPSRSAERGRADPGAAPSPREVESERDGVPGVVARGAATYPSASK